MSIKQLQDHVSDLHDLVQSGGDLVDADSGFLADMLETTGKIIMIFEEDPKLKDLVLTGKNRNYMMDLKILAVTLAKTIPIKERLDSMLDGIDWWDMSDMVDEIHNIVQEVD